MPETRSGWSTTTASAFMAPFFVAPSDTMSAPAVMSGSWASQLTAALASRDPSRCTAMSSSCAVWAIVWNSCGEYTVPSSVELLSDTAQLWDS